MSDIRRRTGRKGTTYQVRYPSKASRTGYAYKTFTTLKEARAFREDAGARSASTALSTEIRTVDQGVQKWLDVCEREGRNGREPVTKYTLANYEYRAGIIRDYPWDKELHELTKPDIIQFRSWLLEQHSRDVANKVLTSFHSMVKELVGRGALAYDMADGVTVAATSRYDEPVVIPSEREIQELLAAADRLANSRNRKTQKTWERYRPMLYLAVDSGMRPQEYLVLAKASIKETGVEVDRALEGGGTEITVTKTRAGRRFIDLSTDTLGMIRHYADHKSIKNEYDLVFPTSTGKWQSVRNWRNRGFASVCEEAGLMVKVKEDGETVERPKYKPYDLRHFYASMLIDQRVNLKRIQTLMGHRNIQTTLNVYGHLIERVEAAQQSPVSVLGCMRQNSCGKSVASAV
ncbi:site-specific integrase [Sinorhizobium meliloti]|uniref:tyrosine-type recombinase/integrase n=1 Tax=Rhizobium meliloti TaxID=382 RepID=UPI00299DDDDC|nr:tyrosine-type recombinase/integrase [Sinorhizobium meliloti]